MDFLESYKRLLATRYLGDIAAHFIEFGPWQNKTAGDLAYELSWHNAHAGEGAPEVTLPDLLNASHDQIAVMEKQEGVRPEVWQLNLHMQHLIEQAIAHEAAISSYYTLRNISRKMEGAYAR